MSREYKRDTSIFGLVPRPSTIILYDDFEPGLLLPIVTGTGGDQILELDTSIAAFGGTSLYLKTRTTSAADGDQVLADYKRSLRPGRRAVIEVLFMSPDLAKIEYFILNCWFYDGTLLRRFALQYSPNTPELSYRDSAGVHQAIPGGGVASFNNAWHHMAFSLDFVTPQYLSARFDHLEFDLTGSTLESTANATGSFLRLQPGIEANAGAPAECYIDNILIHEI